jgi:hypothetical protein
MIGNKRFAFLRADVPFPLLQVDGQSPLLERILKADRKWSTCLSRSLLATRQTSKYSTQKQKADLEKDCLAVFGVFEQ